MATHSGVLPWEIPWTKEPGMLQSMGSQRVGYDLATKQQTAHKGDIWVVSDLLEAVLLRIALCTYCFVHMEVYLWDKPPKVEFLCKRLYAFGNEIGLHKDFAS